MANTRSVVFTVTCLLIALSFSPSHAFSPLVIDDFNYATSEAARAVWKSSGPDPVVMAATGEWGDTRALVLPVQFTTDVQRRYWDATVSLDLSNVSVFEMEVYVQDAMPISSFTLYFHSGEAWMAKASPFPRPDGRNGNGRNRNSPRRAEASTGVRWTAFASRPGSRRWENASWR